MLYFTADLHLGHANIIKHCNRPFANVQEMDAALVNRWNSIVTADDTVYVIGDFACFSKYKASAYTPLLNGKIVLIPGSHDDDLKMDLFASTATNGWVDLAPAIHVITVGNGKAQRSITMCHYPMHSWPKSHFNHWHLHGHHHYRLDRPGKTLNVCCDLWDYTPVSLDVVKGYMESQGDNWDFIKE